MSKKRKIIIWISSIFALLVVTAIIIFVLWINGIIGRITNGQGNFIDLFTETYQPLQTDENGRTNILAFGTSGFDMSGTDYDQSTHDGAELTDSLMVISLNQDTGDAVMISLPRDLKVTSYCTTTAKINEVYWCNNMEGNDENAGATALMNEVGDILGIDFQYYAHINWGSLESIVDALGGITVTLDEDIYDYYYTDAVFEANTPYEINGAEAVALARARHGTANGDFSRGASQQKILIGIKDKVISSHLSVSDLLNLANTLGDNLRTNFSVGEMKTLAHLAETLDFTTIRQVSFLEPEPLMTTATIYGISYVIPSAGDGDFTDIKAYIAQILSPDPITRENASILILNSTSEAGLADAEATSLAADGLTNVTTGNSPTGEYSKQYTLYATTDQAPSTQSKLEEKYNTPAKPADELPASITPDHDFILIIGS